MILWLLFLLGGYLFVSKIPYFEKHQLDESAERKSNSENSKIKINAAGLKVWETLWGHQERLSTCHDAQSFRVWLIPKELKFKVILEFLETSS